MKHDSLFCSLGALLASAGVLTAAPLGPAFTYHGRLLENGNPVNGDVDLVFTLWDAPDAGAQIGGADSLGDVPVANGLFTVQVNSGDAFGPDAFSGQARWLRIEVAPAGTGNFTTLSPRQPLTAVPYATFAAAPWSATGNDVFYAAGNVGIGTTSPTARLEIGGTPGVDGIKFPDGSLQVTAPTGGTGFWTGAGSHIFNNNSGNVGINRNDPLFAFDVRANSGFGARLGMQGIGGGSLVVACNPFDNRVWLEGYNSTDDGSADEMLITGYAGGPLPRLTLSAVRTSIYGSVEINAQDGLTTTGYQPFLTLSDTNAGNARVVIQQVDGNYINFFTQNGLNIGLPPVRIHNEGLEVFGQNAVTLVGYQPFITFSDTSTGFARGRIQSVGGDLNFFTEASFATGVPPLKVYNSGMTQVRTLQIIGGADLAEPFDVAGDDVEPGMVVVIDPAHPGQLRPCTQRYDRKVAGIVSGAGGVATGLSMGHEETLASGRHPVALTGRVYCLADASEAPIEPGDLLTTSAMRGHAMKAVHHEKAQGAVLGKAMTPLAEGTGMVLVLVALQ